MTRTEQQFLSIAEKRTWLARIFRDTTGGYTDADKFKAMVEDTKLFLNEKMKTPKRHHKIPAEHSMLDLEPDSWEEDYHAQEARWKRKNRTAQLKRTIARLEAENFELEYLFTRITYDGTMSDMLTF